MPRILSARKGRKLMTILVIALRFLPRIHINAIWWAGQGCWCESAKMPGALRALQQLKSIHSRVRLKEASYTRHINCSSSLVQF